MCCNRLQVHVGAGCPSDKVSLLLRLLDPTVTSQLLVPVDSQLMLLTQHAEGGVTPHVVSGVRFSELEVPSDAAIVLASVTAETCRKCKVSKFDAAKTRSPAETISRKHFLV